MSFVVSFFFFQAEDGIRDLVRSRGLGDVYKRQALAVQLAVRDGRFREQASGTTFDQVHGWADLALTCLLYTSDAADERSSVALGGRRIIKKKNNHHHTEAALSTNTKKHENNTNHHKLQ
mgnify:CR=1 FL=1